MQITKRWGLYIYLIFLSASLISCTALKEGIMPASDMAKGAAVQGGNAYYHFSLAQLLASKGDVDGAIEQYKEAIRLEPKTPVFHVELATVYIRKSENNTALKYLEDAVKIAQDYTPAYLLLGNVYTALKRDDEAMEAYNKAISLEPKNHKAYIYICLVIFRLKGNSLIIRLHCLIIPF